MNILIPAAGRGSRFLGSKYTVPKPQIIVDGEPMIITAAKKLGFRGRFIFILQEHENRDITAAAIYASFPFCNIAVIDFYTDGAAETSLIAKDLIDTEEELVIANCDQIMDWNYWNSDIALRQLRKYDAGVVTVESNDPKHSYARISDNTVYEIQEKVVISDHALTGIHYWKQGSDFVRTATKMLNENARSNNSEFYIGPTYNYLINENKKVGAYQIDKKAIHFIGTPEDLEVYESRQT
jgi:dTDP-glucose pyrophosphorylase